MQHKVGLLTNIFTPYKEPLLAELAKHVDLKVYYCALKEANRQWKVDFTGRYSYEILKGKILRLGNAYLHVNPYIGRALRSDNLDILIVGGYSYPTVIVAPLFCHALKIPVLLWSG